MLKEKKKKKGGEREREKFPNEYAKLITMRILVGVVQLNWKRRRTT